EGGVELRPLGHAVDVARDRLERELFEGLRAPFLLVGDHAVDPEGPVVRVDPGGGACREHGPAALDVLAGRQPVAVLLDLPPAASESSRDEVAHVSSVRLSTRPIWSHPWANERSTHRAPSPGPT